SHSSGYDCHEIVKSSGLSSKKRFCCDHGHKCLKVLRASVACQTDSNESDFDFKMAEQFETQGQECATANVSYDQQTVAQDLCHSKDEDGSKPEGVLRLMIHNFRNMNDTVRGPAKLVSGVPWKIMVMPRQHVVAKKGTQKCLGFFLQCCPESYSDSWSCQAAAELRLISQKHGVPNFVRKTNHIYTAKENDWGYSCFMTWADILDESQGYMKEESVILEVFVKAESPKGILTYEAFCKKIQDYMRLSDMQCSRNLIDKALEVNQTALKFCKDKDEMMKEELEKQKTRLIERKLMQSIERIEKGTLLFILE
uniref:MATH domain-containing protein n=1 Tax=Romanomermis culicivorax TaxID=13658 RepID=A0A915IYX5_ROMCU